MARTLDGGADHRVGARELRVDRGGDLRERLRRLGVARGVDVTPRFMRLSATMIGERLPEALAVIADMVAFLDALAGVDGFDFVPVDTGQPVRVICKSYSVTYSGHTYADLSAEFETVREWP